MSHTSDGNGDARYDRALLLHGAKRNTVLTLTEVRQYGADSFGDPDYVKLYGMFPTQWYERGIRLLGRTAVECTRDELADRMARDIAAVAARMRSVQNCIVVDPFSGSCNTLFWILRHLPKSQGLAFESDALVHSLTANNIASLGTNIELHHGDYLSVLPSLNVEPDTTIVAFIAPPWGKALDEATGLDLRGTVPPITEIIRVFDRTFPATTLVLAMQVYEKVNPASLVDVQALLEWSELRVYDLNVAGQNHGLLLGTKNERPQS